MTFLKRSSDYKPGLFWFSVFAMLWATLLLYAGAYTTSIQAGMAFLDWPLSNSSINPDGWLQDEDMRAEHSHRLLGMKLGLLAIALVMWTQLREARKGVRSLALLLLGMIIFQGVLGGMRVLFDQLNTGANHNLVAQTFAVLHAMGAQVTVCLLASLAVVTSRFWITSSTANYTQLNRWGLAAVAVLFVQILLGAVMRHAGAGLAIQTFPLTETGGLLPRGWEFPIAVHWLHRLGALIATFALLGFCTGVLRHCGWRSLTGVWASIVLALLAIQIYLGAATIWTYKNPVMASNHMVVGAFLLASTWTLMMLVRRAVSHRATEPVHDAVPTTSHHESLTQPTLKS
ncbi:MAG: COX15/CtaA family protein [Verrucomicrobiota bacterium]